MATGPGWAASPANICRMPATASEVDSPRRIRASSTFIVASSTGPRTWAARLRPLRPGRARCTGTWSANRVMPLAAWPSRRRTSPGLRPRTSSTVMCVSETSARIGDLDAAQGRVDGLAGVLVVAGGAGAVALRERRGDRRDRAVGDEQRQRRGGPRDARLDGQRQRRLAERGDLGVLRRALERAERELDVGDVVPDQRELAEHRLEQAAGERPVDLGEAALLGRVVRRGAEERLERAEHERQLGAHQHLGVDRVDLEDGADRVRRQLRLRASTTSAGSRR